MSEIRWHPKDPQDVRDYWINFSGLLADGETITVATVVPPTDQPAPTAPFELLVKVSSAIVTDGKWVVARFSGGSPAFRSNPTAGPGKYPIQYHLTTTTGQQLDLTKTLVVKERTA